MREYSFNLEAARRYGVDGAVVLQGMAVWISKNRANERHFHDGRWWTYNSKAALTRLFPFWTEKQLRRIVKSLNEEGALLLGNYSDGAAHNTTWYALSDDVLRMLGADDCAGAEEAPQPPEETTCPNGQVTETTCPNGQVYLPKRAGHNRNQIDTTVPPYNPPQGGVSMAEEFAYVCGIWYNTDNIADKDATFTEYVKARQSTNFEPLRDALLAWVDSLGPARLPLWKVLSGDTWREDPYFWLFWQIYPRKIDKDRARRAWKKLAPARALSLAILESLRRWKICDQWQDERFIPHPATWLNGRRWEAAPPGMRRAPEEPPERKVEEWT